MYAFVILPRSVVCITLCCLGCQYLMVIRTLGDLLLNAMALSFILNVDELFFESLASCGIKLAIKSIEAVEVHPQQNQNCMAKYASFVLKMICLLVSLVSINVVLLDPIFGCWIKQQKFFAAVKLTSFSPQVLPQIQCM